MITRRAVMRIKAAMEDIAADVKALRQEVAELKAMREKPKRPSRKSAKKKPANAVAQPAQKR